MLMVPGGKHSLINDPSARTPKGAFSDGLKIEVFPAASAGYADFLLSQCPRVNRCYQREEQLELTATFHANRIDDTFQAPMPAQTPIGSRCTIL